MGLRDASALKMSKTQTPSKQRQITKLADRRLRFEYTGWFTLVIKKRLSCPIASTSGLLFIIVLTLFRGRSTSFDLRGEFAATVAVAVLEDNSATLRLALPSAMVRDPSVSETKEYYWQGKFDRVCDNNFNYGREAAV